MLFGLVNAITKCLFAQQFFRTDGSCKSNECQYTAEVYARRIRPSIEPCDNFFNNVCGNYYSGQSINGPYVNPFSEREHEIDEKISNFLLKYDGPRHSDPIFPHIRSFYTACTIMDTNAVSASPIENLNLWHIENELNFLGLSLNYPSDEQLSDEMFPTETLARLHATSVGVSGFLFKISVEVRETESNHQRVIKIAEAFDIILKNFNHYDSMGVSMNNYLVSVLEEFHKNLKIEMTPDEIEIFKSQASRVSEFLFEFKKINETPRKTIMKEAVMNVQSFQDLINQELAEGEVQLNWKRFLQVLYGLDNQSVESIVESTEKIIVLYDVEKFKQILQLLRKTDFETFISAIWWTAVDMLLYQNAQPFYQYHKIYDTYRPMFIPIKRKSKCLKWVRKHFPLFVAHVLATEQDSSKIKEEVEDMVTNIKKSFSKNLRKNKWLSQKTQDDALKKLENIKFTVGYTDSILKSDSVEKAYGNTPVEYTDFLPVLCELFRKERKKNLLVLLPQASPFNELELNTAEVEVKYNPLAQSVVVPMSILGFSFYKLGLHVLNYGAVGVHIAYRIARAFDYIWTKPEAKDIADCFRADGEVTLFSNIADAVGFKVTMDAYIIRAKAKNYEQTFPIFEYKDDEKLATKKAVDKSPNVKSPNVKSPNVKSPNVESPNVESPNVKLPNVKSPDDEFACDVSFYHESPDDVSPAADKNKKKLFIREEKDEKLFIRAFANTLCEKGSKEYYVQKTESDDISVNMARVNGVLRNIDVFARKWNCSHKKWMNPPKKCKIWN